MKKLLAFLLGALLLATSPAYAAFGITYITNSSNNNNTGSVHSISSAGNFSEAIGTLVIVEGVVIGLNSASDSVYVTDGAGNTYTTYQCPEAAGSTNVSFVSWSRLTSALSSQKITIADTNVGGTNISASGAMIFFAHVLTGADTTTVEDTAARGCGGSTTATTTPTMTTGTPATSGDFVVSAYGAPAAYSTFSWTPDTGNGWANMPSTPFGTSRQFSAPNYQTNPGAGALTNSPTTTSTGYMFASMSFCPSTGCTAASSTNPSLGMLLGVQP